LGKFFTVKPLAGQYYLLSCSAALREQLHLRIPRRIAITASAVPAR
jgi:hypothetical protein